MSHDHINVAIQNQSQVKQFFVHERMFIVSEYCDAMVFHREG